MSKNKGTFRVGTMTFHMAHNYGAMLQAYALEKTVNKLGYDCEVIDYRFAYINNWSGVETAKDIIRQIGLLKGTYSSLIRMLKGNNPKQSKLQKNFNKFMRKKLRLSKKIYKYPEELSCARYDAILLGSDQIWNPSLTDGVAPEYFGANFDNNVKVSAYAASCGTDGYNDDVAEKILPLLKNLKYISVREKGFERYLREKHKIDVRTVLDPVFLLTKDDWTALIKREKLLVSKPYLLLYAIDNNEKLVEIARKIAALKKLQLVSINYKTHSYANDMLQLDTCSPIQFLSLIKNADYICTSSFHGEAFSIIFNKPFCCMKHEKFAQRNIDLLSTFELTDRMVSCVDDLDNLLPCDYTNANKILLNKRIESIDFLLEAIEG